MSVEGVRMGRIPNTEKEKVLEVFHQGGSDFSSHELLVKQTDNGNYSFKLNPTNAASVSTSSPPLDSKPEIPTQLSTQNTSSTETGATKCELLPPKVEFPNDRNFKDCHYKVHESSHGEPVINTDLAHAHNSHALGHLHHGFNNSQHDGPPVKKPKTEYDSLSDETHFDDSSSFVNCVLENFPVSSCNPNTETATERNLMSGLQDQPNRSFTESTQTTHCGNPFSDGFESLPRSCRSYAGDKHVNFKKNQTWGPRNIPISSQETGLEHCSDFAEGAHSDSSLASLDSGFVHDFSITSRATVKQSFRGHAQARKSSSDLSSDLEVNNIVKDDNSGLLSRSVSFSPSGCSDSSNSSRREFQSPGKRSCFSPALVNVLLEQVLDSNNGVNVIAEKIKEKLKQGNLGQGFVENLSKRMNEVSTKRQLAEAGFSPPGEHCRAKHESDLFFQNSSADVDEFLREIEKRRDLHYATSGRGLSERGSFRQERLTAENVLHGRKFIADTGRDASQYRPLREEDSPFGGSTGDQVTSSALSAEEEQKQQEIRLTLDGINLGMKILERLKPEHREKIRQLNLGQIHIRKMTDSEQDVQETYTKIIRGIPDLNERILGFCNSVPGFETISKEDRDTLMKRAYYDIWMLSHSEYFKNGVSMMFLATGEIYSEKAMRKILNDDMVDTIFKFAEKFNGLQLTDMEVAILCAARLTAPDDLELENRDEVNKLHSLILDAFAFEMKHNHPANHSRLLIDTFRLMPLLETVNRIQREVIAKYSVNKFVPDIEEEAKIAEGNGVIS